MGNLIVGKQHPTKLCVSMNNSSTEVVISLLSMAASDLSSTRSEMDLSVAISARDQSLLGQGCVGFDIRGLPWSRTEIEFNADKNYFSQVIGLASSGYGAERLKYEPGLDLINPIFKDFNKLLEGMEFEDVCEYEIDRTLIPEFPYEKCNKHVCYKHLEGCVICNAE